MLAMALTDIEDSAKTKIIASGALGCSGVPGGGNTRVGLHGAASESLIFSSSKDT
jgi:hypothetical protein